MRHTFTLVALFVSIFTHNIFAQQITGFNSITPLSSFPITNNSGEKSQSKVWAFAGTHWTVMPDAEGTHIWRLDCTDWVKVAKISSSSITKADCKVVGNKVHILLFRISPAVSQLLSYEFVSSTWSYKPWSKNSSPTDVIFDAGAKTATIDIDSKGRLWLASNTNNSVEVRWSDMPYSSLSSPITIESGITNDDICTIIALPDKIGVFWSNQNTRLFGFKTHLDGASPNLWSEDEVPASHSALNVGLGLADDHMNMAVASDGTLYCATKTQYDTRGYPRLALLVREPNGVWDDLYVVSETGTRPIVLLNEELRKIKIVYVSQEYGGDILYRESPLSDIAISPPMTLISGMYNNPTSSKDNYTSEIVILASTETEAVSVLANDLPDEAVCVLPRDGQDFTVYPNPFSDQTNLYFTLFEPLDYKITMYDSKGSLVSVLRHGTAKAGERNIVNIAGHKFARGQYFICLETPYEVRTLKIIREVY